MMASKLHKLCAFSNQVSLDFKVELNPTYQLEKLKHFQYTNSNLMHNRGRAFTIRLCHSIDVLWEMSVKTRLSILY